MVKHAHTIRWLLPMDCLSVFEHFVGLLFKGLDVVFIYNGLKQSLVLSGKNEFIALCIQRQFKTHELTNSF